MTTAKRPGLGAVLARPACRRLFAAQTISRWGDTFNTVALVVLLFRLTGSGLGSPAPSWPRSPRYCCWLRWPAR